MKTGRFLRSFATKNADLAKIYAEGRRFVWFTPCKKPFFLLKYLIRNYPERIYYIGREI